MILYTPLTDQVMFGILHCNKDAPDKINFVELSESRNGETRSQAILVSAPIQRRPSKLM